MAKRASLKKLKKFANEVREAGGGNPIDALIPSVPQDTGQCLIARNLNFNCEVMTTIAHGDEYVWVMSTKKSIAKAIAENLNLEYKVIKEDGETRHVVVLPEDIGQVASDFDTWNECVTNSWVSGQEGGKWTFTIRSTATKEEIKRLKTFWPYIDESIKEAYANATFVKDGKIVV